MPPLFFYDKYVNQTFVKCEIRSKRKLIEKQ